jgi:hypothetical protein
MKRAFVSLSLFCAGVGHAGDWHAAAGAGFGIYRYAAVTAPAGTAEAGIGPRFALTILAGRRLAGWLDLDGALTFQDGDFEVRSGDRKSAFDARAFAPHLNLVVRPLRRCAPLRPYFEAGGGARFYQGIETPSHRPLEEYASFRRATDTRPLFAFGGGLEWALSERWTLRLDLRDYATPFPSSVIAPAPGATVHGWLHDFVPTLALEFH